MKIVSATAFCEERKEAMAYGTHALSMAFLGVYFQRGSLKL